MNTFSYCTWLPDTESTTYLYNRNMSLVNISYMSTRKLSFHDTSISMFFFIWTLNNFLQARNRVSNVSFPTLSYSWEVLDSKWFLYFLLYIFFQYFLRLGQWICKVIWNNFSKSMCTFTKLRIICFYDDNPYYVRCTPKL